MTKLTKKWFTLIEMLIVIVIIGILAWVLLPKIGWAKDKANDVAVTANVKNLGTAIIQYDMDNNGLPTDLWDALTGNKAEKYWVSISYSDATDATKYQYKKDSDNKHFLVCGKYSQDNNAWNMSSDGITDWTYTGGLSTTWNWYCYQG